MWWRAQSPDRPAPRMTTSKTSVFMSAVDPIVYEVLVGGAGIDYEDLVE